MADEDIHAGNCIRVAVVAEDNDATTYGTMMFNAILKAGMESASEVGHTGGLSIYEPQIWGVSQFVGASKYAVQLRRRLEVFVTVGDAQTLQAACAAQVRTYDELRRWVHVDTVKQFVDGCKLLIRNCCGGYVTGRVDRQFNDPPLISIVTTAFRSGERLRRPWDSLRAQGYAHWEWIVVDDNFDEEQCRAQLDRLTDCDPRVTYVRAGPGGRHSGYIGEVKRRGFMLANGLYIVELDHDDTLAPQFLQHLVDLIKDFTETHEQPPAFVYSDCVELFESTHKDFFYGTTFARGTGSHYRCYFPNIPGEQGSANAVTRGGSLQYVAVVPPLNETSLSHIVGAPNHVRVWETTAYREAGGHSQRLSVVDDYDLILRTFAKYATRCVKLRCPEYYQYRTESGSNFTVKRNAMIQHYVPMIWDAHSAEVKAQFAAHGPQWATRFVGEHYEYNWDPMDRAPAENPCISIVIPTYNRPDMLRRALRSVLVQTYTNWVLYVIGDCCPEVDGVMAQFVEDNFVWMQTHGHRVRWFNLDTNYGPGGAVPRNYALERLVSTEWVAYLDDDNVFEPDHLASAVDIIKQRACDFVISDFDVDGGSPVRCPDVPQRGSVDTSCIVHRLSLLVSHGFWKDRTEAGYAHDWELVSRWISAGAPYALTHRVTMHYFTTAAE